MKAFATISPDLSYWQKQTTPLFTDLYWNVPEQKFGTVNVIGGNSQNFATPVKIAEYLTRNFPIKHLNNVFPDILKSKFPPLPNLIFTPSTSSGSFAKTRELITVTNSANANLFIGDLSRNSETLIALSLATQPTAELVSAGHYSHFAKPLNVLTRDTIDLLAPEIEPLLRQPKTILVASMIQLQKVFRAIFYPKMILLSQPLIPIIETLHKFTLSYSATLLTFHQNNLIVASSGKIITTHLVDTHYSPITLWAGELAAKVTVLNLFNPHKTLEATTAAIHYQPGN